MTNQGLTKTAKQLDAEIAASVKQAAAVKKLTAAVRKAQASWTGLDRETDLTCGNRDDDYKSDKALQAAKDKEREEIESEAESASEHGDEALTAATAGNWPAAIKWLMKANRIEDQYGDSPSWRPVLDLAEELAESLTEDA